MYERELSELRQRLNKLAAEQTSLPLDTELAWGELPEEICQEIVRNLQANGYAVSLGHLARSKIKLGIMLRLQVASVFPDKALIEWLPFGGD